MPAHSANHPASGVIGEPVSRRRFVAGASALAGACTALAGAGAMLALPATAAAPPATPEGVRALCAALNGGRSLSLTEAKAYLVAFSGPVTGSQLDALVDLAAATPADALGAAITAAGLDDMANEFTGAVYSGMAGPDDDLQVVTYDDALCWGALPFTKPGAQCGGLPGYWRDLPST
jgi:hypothetical protein